MIDSAIVSPRAFQGHRETRLVGSWRAGSSPVSLPAGTIVVPVAQRLGVLAMYLFEPESDDGLFAWDVGGRSSMPDRASRGIVRLATRPEAKLERE